MAHAGRDPELAMFAKVVEDADRGHVDITVEHDTFLGAQAMLLHSSCWWMERVELQFSLLHTGARLHFVCRCATTSPRLISTFGCKVVAVEGLLGMLRF